MLDLKKVVDQGWLEIDFPHDQSLLKLAEQYGHPIGIRLNANASDVLIPREKKDAKVHSLSAEYGMEAFPFHTDCAYYLVPPRFIFFRSKIVNNNCATLLHKISNLHFSPTQIELLKTGLFEIRGHHKMFFASLLEKGIFRWDKNCVKAIDRTAKEAVEVVENMLKSTPPHKYYWINKNKVLIVDNWQVLHAREESSSFNRAIERILIEEKKNVNLGL